MTTSIPTKRPRDGLWWVSTSLATFGVTVRNGLVIPEHTAPFGQRFAHQPFERLVNWLTHKDPAFAAEHLLDPGERVSEEVRQGKN